MQLLVSMVTFNRLDYTKRTIESFQNTIQVPHYLLICDNNSSDGTQEYLKELYRVGGCDNIILNPDNYYPGKATNIGWEYGLRCFPQATHLMRLDNDMHFENGWDLLAEKYFETIPQLGQVGLDFDGGENKPCAYYNGLGLNSHPGNVGGPNIIKREIFDKGVRYSEVKWCQENSITGYEDTDLSLKIQEMGYLMGHMQERLSWTFAVNFYNNSVYNTKENWEYYKDYYLQTMHERGLDTDSVFLSNLQ